MSEDEDTTNDGSRYVTTKPAQLKVFINKRPRGAASLVMLASAEGSTVEQQLGTWPVDELMTPALAGELLDTLREYAEALEQDCRAKLAWFAASGTQLGGVKVITATQERAPATHFGSEPNELNGSDNSRIVQMQKHVEVMFRMHTQNTNATLHQVKQLTDRAMELAEHQASARAEAEERYEQMRRERDKAQEERDEAMAGAGVEQTPDEAATEASQTQILKLFENPMVQAAVMRMLTGGGPSAPPQA